MTTAVELQRMPEELSSCVDADDAVALDAIDEEVTDETTNEDEPLLEIICAYCDQLITSMSELKGHLSTAHYDDTLAVFFGTATEQTLRTQWLQNVLQKVILESTQSVVGNPLENDEVYAKESVRCMQRGCVAVPPIAKKSRIEHLYINHLKKNSFKCLKCDTWCLLASDLHAVIDHSEECRSQWSENDVAGVKDEYIRQLKDVYVKCYGNGSATVVDHESGVEVMKAVNSDSAVTDAVPVSVVQEQTPPAVTAITTSTITIEEPLPINGNCNVGLLDAEPTNDNNCATIVQPTTQTGRKRKVADAGNIDGDVNATDIVVLDEDDNSDPKKSSNQEQMEDAETAEERRHRTWLNAEMNKRKPVECNMCHKVVTDRRRHVYVSHLDQAPFRCPEIGCPFESRRGASEVAGHLRSVHPRRRAAMPKQIVDEATIEQFLIECFALPPMAKKAKRKSADADDELPPVVAPSAVAPDDTMVKQLEASVRRLNKVDGIFSQCRLCDRLVAHARLVPHARHNHMAKAMASEKEAIAAVVFSCSVVGCEFEPTMDRRAADSHISYSHKKIKATIVEQKPCGLDLAVWLTKCYLGDARKVG